jgi:hypothetical protein
MIREHCHTIAEYLMSCNPWLRDFAYITRKQPKKGVRASDDSSDDHLGIDDRKGNHAYIRYATPGKDVTFSDPGKKTTDRHRIATTELVLVCVLKTDQPEEIAYQLGKQIASCPIPGATIALLQVDSGRGEILIDEIGADSEAWKAARVRFSISWPEHFRICNNPTELTIMDRCCMDPIDLGCAGACDDLATGFTLAAGKYNIEYRFDGTTRTVEIEHAGGKLTIPMAGVNEGYTYTVRVIATDGTIQEFTQGDQTSNCLEFKTTPGR